MKPIILLTGPCGKSYTAKAMMELVSKSHRLYLNTSTFDAWLADHNDIMLTMGVVVVDEIPPHRLNYYISTVQKLNKSKLVPVFILTCTDYYRKSTPGVYEIECNYKPS